MAEQESEQSEDTGLDPELDEILSREPEVRISLCPHCQREVNGDGYWVIENSTDGFYTGYCNEFHYQIHHRVGLWAEEQLPPPLPL